MRLFVAMMILTGAIYPLLILFIAQTTMPFLANGSLVDNKSLLFAQKTVGEGYFWPRPSATDYDPLKPAGGSQLGPTSAALKKLVAERKKQYGEKAPSELFYSSGSGLDPHITLEAAYFQGPRVAKARSMKEDEVKRLIDSLKEGKQLKVLGPHYVNVSVLNRELDGRRVR